MRIKPISLRHLTRPLDDLRDIDNPNFEGIVTQIYPPDLKLNKANTSETEAPFLHLHLSISNVFSAQLKYRGHIGDRDTSLAPKVNFT